MAAAVPHHERTETLVVGAEQTGGRLDRVLAEGLPALSRTRLKALILEGAVTSNGRAILDPGIFWGSYQVPILLQVGIVVVAALALLFAAVKLFARTE